MDAKKGYAEQLQKERKRIRGDISSSLEPQGLNLITLQIMDDGYVVDAMPTASKNGRVSFKELCKRVDTLEFENYAIVDITFSTQVVNMVLVPITVDAMNDFIWNYIMCHLPFVNELESLSLAIGVLEHMVQPLGKEVEAEYEKLISMLIK